jgi:RNA polymerase sigma factor (sigma-70 family)
MMPSEVQDQPSAPSDIDQMFEQAVRIHSRRMLAVARGIIGNRASPEDVVQQALTNLFQHRARYDWRDPGGLIRRAVVNEAIRILRHPRTVRVADDHPGELRPPAARMINEETVTKVRAAIDQLPSHFRAALILCEYENMAYAQIAQVLGVTMPQVKTWLHRGRRQLAGLLEDFVKPPAPRPARSGDLPVHREIPARRSVRGPLHEIRRHPDVRMPTPALATN